jgi:hypothetical protein
LDENNGNNQVKKYTNTKFGIKYRPTEIEGRKKIPKIL